MKNIVGKIRTIRIGKYFNNLDYNERDTNKVYATKNKYLHIVPASEIFSNILITISAIFDSYSTSLGAIF